MKVKVIFYEKQFERKPDNVGIIQKQLKPVEMEIQDLANAMSNGATFRPEMALKRRLL